MSRTRVLVVEDEEDVARAISIRLDHAGYEVMTAGRGTDAIRMAQTELPNLVILDIGLPDQNGHEVAQRLSTLSATITTPIIFLTARISEVDRALAFQVSPIAYLTKPYSPRELLSVVSRAEAASCQMRCSENIHEGRSFRDSKPSCVVPVNEVNANCTEFVGLPASTRDIKRRDRLANVKRESSGCR